eukprot:IDg13929t1
MMYCIAGIPKDACRAHQTITLILHTVDLSRSNALLLQNRTGRERREYRGRLHHKKSTAKRCGFVKSASPHFRRRIIVEPRL